MDIGVPFRDLGPVDVTAAAEHVADMPESAWTENRFRQDVLADEVHSVTQSILFRHEWRRWENPWGVNTLEELVEKWAERVGIDPAPFGPIARVETDVGPVYTFPDWTKHEAVLGPLVERAIDYVRTSTGIITRLALVVLPPGGYIKPHDDGQHMAHKAHRLHVPLTSSPRVEYKIGHKKFHMKIGRVYDFNNRWRHSVRHKGKRPRINLFIDYYPNPGLYVPPPYGHH